MRHVLIIEDNIIVSGAIQARLSSLGFYSFEFAWTEEDAVAAARRRAPDLLVIGDHLEEGCPLEAARKISGFLEVPTIMVTGAPCQERQLGDSVSVEAGPFNINQIADALLSLGPQKASGCSMGSPGTAGAELHEPD